jgi:DNA adenine methylase
VLEEKDGEWEKVKLTCIAPWFGSKRTMAPVIVRQLGPHQYYFGGCCGSLAVEFAKELSEHECVCDMHGALTNLAWVVQDAESAAELFNQLQRVWYSDELYQASKDWLTKFERTESKTPEFSWAYHYFIASWMGRNGVAGTARVNYQIATRWTKGGGSGPLRFKNAVDSIPAWCERLRNIQILRRSVFDVLPKIEDGPGVAIYCDPPYLPETVSGNSRYLHDFTEADHKRLADILRTFKRARVVVSYYAAPQLQKLYPGWTVLDCSRRKHLHCQNKRGSTRTEAPEVLLVNGPELHSGDGDLFGTYILDASKE